MAGTISGVLTRIQTQQGRPQMAKLTLTCVGDASDGGFPATVLNDLQTEYDLRGLQLYSIKVIPGLTAPTDSSDITITDEDGVDLLGAKGTNLISATLKTWALFGPSGYTVSALITGDVTINISNNIVHSATIKIIIELIGV
ncbi:MAG: hypothetical protein WCY05_07220 [Candidatus Omnitrophota bacterium]